MNPESNPHMLQMKLTVEISQKAAWWCAYCKQMDCSGFGATEQEAIANLRIPILSTMQARMETALIKASEAATQMTESNIVCFETQRTPRELFADAELGNRVLQFPIAPPPLHHLAGG